MALCLLLDPWQIAPPLTCLQSHTSLIIWSRWVSTFGHMLSGHQAYSSIVTVSPAAQPCDASLHSSFVKQPLQSEDVLQHLCRCMLANVAFGLYTPFPYWGVRLCLLEDRQCIGTYADTGNYCEHASPAEGLSSSNYTAQNAYTVQATPVPCEYTFDEPVWLSLSLWGIQSF